MKPLQGDREAVILRKCYGAIVSRHRKKQFIGTPLTLQEFVYLVEQPCCYCGHTGSNKKYDHKAGGRLHSHVVVRVNGLDRVDNNQGYTLSNSISCCRFCNSAKSIMSVDYFKAWVKQVYDHLNLGEN